MKIFDDTTEVYETLHRLAIGINTISTYILLNNLEDIEGIHLKMTPELKDAFNRMETDSDMCILFRNKTLGIFFRHSVETDDGVVIFGDYYGNEAKEIKEIIINKIKNYETDKNA